jgi:hypothetical protein
METNLDLLQRQIGLRAAFAHHSSRFGGQPEKSPDVRQVTTTAATRQEERTGEGDLPGLMARYQRGDVAAIEELVRRLSPPLLRFFSFSQVSIGEAEDLLQDCWLRIHRSRQTYRASEPVLPWIFAIARHTRLDGHRRRQRRMSREVLVADPPESPSTVPGT